MFLLLNISLVGCQQKLDHFSMPLSTPSKIVGVEEELKGTGSMTKVHMKILRHIMQVDV